MLGEQAKRDLWQNGQDITSLLPAAKSCLSIAGHTLHRNGYFLGPSQYIKG